MCVCVGVCVCVCVRACVCARKQAEPAEQLSAYVKRDSLPKQWAGMHRMAEVRARAGTHKHAL
jgi:hypothetical protein